MVHYGISIYTYRAPWLDSPPPSFSFIPRHTLKIISTIPDDMASWRVVLESQ
jgi:hypothetical protein